MSSSLSFQPSPRAASRLFAALLASALAHGLILAGSGLVRLPAPRPKVMEVELRPAEETVPAEPLLKNTIETPEQEEKPAPPPEKTESPSGTPRPAAKPKPEKMANPIAAAQRKLSKHLYYPPEAIAAGLEGEVRLLLTLDDKGAILDADVAASSGHTVLDKAAVRAAFAMGSVDGANKKEMILPVVFRLR